MPAESVPYVAAVLAYFGTFMVVVGGVSIWSYLPDKKPKASAQRASLPGFARPAV